MTDPHGEQALQKCVGGQQWRFVQLLLSQIVVIVHGVHQGTHHVDRCMCHTFVFPVQRFYHFHTDALSKPVLGIKADATWHILTFCRPCISVYISHYLTNLIHKICFTISFISCLHVSGTCAHHQEVKIALHSLWYHTYRWPSRAQVERVHSQPARWYQRLCNAIFDLMMMSTCARNM